MTLHLLNEILSFTFIGLFTLVGFSIGILMIVVAVLTVIGDRSA